MVAPMLNSFLALLALTGWGGLHWLARHGPTDCKPQGRALLAWWQAHALFTAWALWLDGLQATERLWLQTFWPEAWLGLMVWLSLWGLYLGFTRLWLGLRKQPEQPFYSRFLLLAWLAGWVLAYLSQVWELPASNRWQAAIFLMLAALAALLCGRGNLRATFLRVAAFLASAWLVLLFLRQPRAAMEIAGSLPGHYNSLIVAGLLLPWLLLPLWLLFPLLAGRMPAGFCQPLFLCYRRPVHSRGKQQ